MKIKLIISLLFVGLLYTNSIAQSIQGIVIDEISQQAIPFVNVVIIDSDPLIGAATDIDGKFSINQLPSGRYRLQASVLGYESAIILDVIVSNNKAAEVIFQLKENIANLKEIVIKPKVQKSKPLNRMASVSARMLSVEEANRYAGGFDDPARLATSFPGVASGVGNNAIVIRGNSPKYTKWMMEGIEISNPNHFADLDNFGGGGLTALSSNLLANSDFFTGAFPASYNNALSGVFDMKIRNGNSKKHEHEFQLGVIGIDFKSEGPLNNSKNSSYLFNYRYSTLGLVSPLLPEDAKGINFQDLAFKFNFPTKNGYYSIWGIGLLDNSGDTAEADPESWEYLNDRENNDIKQFMASFGVNHRHFLNKKTFIHSSLALTSNGINLFGEAYNDDLTKYEDHLIKANNYNYTLKSYINSKLSSKSSIQSGFELKALNYDILIKDDTDEQTLETLVDSDGSSYLASAYLNAQFQLNKISLSFGLNTQWFNLTDEITLEPRLGLQYSLSENHQLSLAYGLHSRMERLSTYFMKAEGSSELPNMNLELTKAHHFVLGYDWDLSSNMHFKIESYYQHLYDVPIIENSTFSLINLKDDWYLNDAYVNDGYGRNYGLDLSIEQYLTRGFYFLVSGSLFKSEYSNDKINWFNTRYNRSYIINALAGFEWSFGSDNQKRMNINLRTVYQGGERESAIDLDASQTAKDVIYDLSNPYNEQLSAAFVTHFTINYQWEKKKSSRQLSLKIINAFNYKEFQEHRYNHQTGQIDESRDAIMIPNLSYRISF